MAAGATFSSSDQGSLDGNTYRLGMDKWGEFSELRFSCTNQSGQIADAKVMVNADLRQALLGIQDTEVPWTSPLALGTTTRIGNNTIWTEDWDAGFRSYSGGGGYEIAIDRLDSGGQWGGYFAPHSVNVQYSECTFSMNANDGSFQTGSLWVRPAPGDQDIAPGGS